MNKLFKSFMLISIVLLLPLSSMAEDSVRFSYRLGGSVSDPALGTKSVSYFQAATGSEKGTGEEKTDTVSYSAYSLHFINFGYGLGSFEIVGSYRAVTSKTEAPLDTSKGVGAMISKDVLDSSGTDTSMMLGFGYLF